MKGVLQGTNSMETVATCRKVEAFSFHISSFCPGHVPRRDKHTFPQL